MLKIHLTVFLFFMKNHPYSFLLIAILMLFSFACNTKKQSKENTLETKIDSVRQKMREVKKEKLDLIISRLHKKDIFNGVVLVIEKGNVLLKKSYGYADFRNQTKLTENSAFRICSITKQFTTTALLTLFEKGKCKLDDKVQAYLTQFPFENITIRHLLTHTSGLPDYIDAFYNTQGQISTYANNQNVISWVLNDTLKTKFVAGTNWDYSNTNYVLLAELIKNISGKPFAQYVEETILKPLEMTNTVIPDYFADKPIPNRVIGFSNDKETLADESFLDKIQGDGGMYASLNDLEKWDKALYTEKIIKQTTLDLALKPVELSDGSNYNYGFGWHIKPDGKTFFHLGSWLGFRSAILRIPQDQNTIIVLSNNTSPKFDEIVEMIYNILYSQPYQIPK